MSSERRGVRAHYVLHQRTHDTESEEAHCSFGPEEEERPEGAGRHPGGDCGCFGVDAPWLRLAVIPYNVLTALKRLALPPEIADRSSEAMRFQIFSSPGKLILHARQTWLRVQRLKEQLAECPADAPAARAA